MSGDEQLTTDEFKRLEQAAALLTGGKIKRDRKITPPINMPRFTVNLDKKALEFLQAKSWNFRSTWAKKMKRGLFQYEIDSFNRMMTEFHTPLPADQ